ncbi:ABC transporter ATP-binding protein [Photobacterium chitinilyticum]|uniref:ABC transporter ATP-binding protein n=1 Tax=Photobacterium chitinilyticum TaxID=2485123 RepID=UPI003D0B9C3A
MLSKPLVELTNVSKYFSESNSPLKAFIRALLNRSIEINDRVVALENINLAISKGETVGLIGRNGAGKSTLLQVICGIYHQDMGVIKKPKKIGAILELGAGFNQEFSGVENATLSAKLQGVNIKNMREYLDGIHEFSELGEYFYKPVKTYSSGMYARLAFAVAISIEPELLIVDEALSVGDISFQNKCFNKIEELKSKGTTIIFVSHDIFSVRRICERIIWLKDGTIYKDGNVRDVSSLYVEEMYNGTNNGQSYGVWGEDTGIINSCRLNNTVVKLGEDIIIKFSLDQSRVATYNNNLVASISVKDKNGVDIIVLSESLNKAEKSNDFSFKFENILRDGEYIVACAVEIVNNNERRYLEYREDACSLKSISKNNIHGLVLPRFDVEKCND